MARRGDRQEPISSGSRRMFRMLHCSPDSSIHPHSYRQCIYERICKAKIQNVSTKRIYISYHAEDAILTVAARKLISKLSALLPIISVSWRTMLTGPFMQADRALKFLMSRYGMSGNGSGPYPKTVPPTLFIIYMKTKHLAVPLFHI